MNTGNGPHPVLGVQKGRQCGRVLDLVGLEAKQADDHLQIVLDPVVNLFEQGLAFQQRGA